MKTSVLRRLSDVPFMIQFNCQVNIDNMAQPTDIVHYDKESRGQSEKTVQNQGQ